MNVTDDTERQAAALAAYNANYQNESYLRVQVALVQDLWGAFPSGETQALNAALATEPIHSILNLLLCGICFFVKMTNSVRRMP